MKKIGIAAFANESNGGVYQYTQTFIKAVENDVDNEYVVITNESNQVADFTKLKVIKVKDHYVSKLRQYALLVLYYIGFHGMAQRLLSLEERKDYEGIDFLIGCVSNPYPLLYLNIPFVFTFHDLQEYYYPDFFSFPSRMKRKMVGKTLTEKCEGIICESDYVKNDISHFFDVPKNKIYNIPAPPQIDILNHMESSFDEIRTLYKLPENFIFYPSSNFWKHKNHKELIYALGILINERGQAIDLVMSGDCKTKKYQKNIKELIEIAKTLGIEKRLHFIGYIEYEHISTIYKLSKAVAVPTLFESISIPIYEAFAMGIPVCCSNVVALPEQVGNAALIFDPNNANSIAESINTLLTDSEKVKELVCNGKERTNALSQKKYSENLKICIKTVFAKENDSDA